MPTSVWPLPLRREVVRRNAPTVAESDLALSAPYMKPDEISYTLQREELD